MEQRETKPARLYIANAINTGGGFHAQYAFPGGMPRKVTAEHVEAGGSSASTPQIYDTAEQAENAARAALFEALNNRPRSNQTPERYRLLSGPELAEAIRAAGITPTFFCYLWGCSTERFFQWVDEVPDKNGRPVPPPPHGVRVMLEMFRQIPQTIDLAEDITDRVTTQRKPKRGDMAAE